jgi:DNA polymerase III delta prime subunit
MGKTKKLIELDDKAIQILEQQAKLQKRSLKNYIEFTLEDTALRYSEPSEEYKKMMDDKLERLKNGTLKTYSVKEVMKQYGR